MKAVLARRTAAAAILRLVAGFSGCLAALLLLPCVALSENLVSTRTGKLPSLRSDDVISRVLIVDGRPIALGAASTWVLDERNLHWTPDEWRPGGEIFGIADDGPQTFLLVGAPDAGVATRVEQIVMMAGGPASRALPPLPVPLASAHGGVEDGVLHVAGTDSGGALQLFSMNLGAARPAWDTQAEPPDVTGMVTSVVAQNLSVFVTLSEIALQGDRVLRWKPAEGWQTEGELPGPVIDGGARGIGQAHVLYLVNAGSASRLTMFHTITRSWATLTELPVTAIRSATAWLNGILWLQSGTDGRGAVMSFVDIKSSTRLIKIADWIVIAIYLAAMTSIGLYFYLREKRVSTADFFVGGRSIPFWAAGVSLYATNTSSISYIAIPAKAFETNWQYLTNNLVAILALTFVAVWIVPLLRRLDLMSIFQYLEIRFHPAIRAIASALFILVQIGSRLSIILFLPSLAIATVTSLDVVWSILIMGAVTIAYTALGGMKAVIWTDFVQLFVMFGGALFAIGFIIFGLDGGIGEFLSVAGPEGKMKLLDWRWDLTEATVWGFIFLVVFDVVLTFPKDQVLMQRVLSTRSDKEAGRAVWTFAAIMIPGGFMFYLIGTALYVYYQGHPERMDPLMQIDATFPLFIAAELPVGVTGLIIAGILAASMSTLSSIMNSVATLASVDFYDKLVKSPNPKTSVRFAELMTVVTGLIGMGAAWLLSRYDIHSLFDVSIELAGLLGGGFAGAYTLGMFTRRANWQGVSIGIGSAIVLTTVAWSMDLVHPYFYLAISILVCIIVGYLSSLLFPPPPGSLAGLTIHLENAAIGSRAAK